MLLLPRLLAQGCGPIPDGLIDTGWKQDENRGPQPGHEGEHSPLSLPSLASEDTELGQATTGTDLLGLAAKIVAYGMDSISYAQRCC